MSGEQEGHVVSAALLRLPARINRACVKKSPGCNYTEMEGQRGGSLFDTAWTLLLTASENRMYVPQKRHCAPWFSLRRSICHAT